MLKAGLGLLDPDYLGYVIGEHFPYDQPGPSRRFHLIAATDVLRKGGVAMRRKPWCGDTIIATKDKGSRQKPITQKRTSERRT
ncbi:MAG: hypothetical protein MZV70_44955 [Desulfobacterales bacterium]|nr:hypothetical protein [Desulfobacterales bacterium]